MQCNGHVLFSGQYIYTLIIRLIIHTCNAVILGLNYAHALFKPDLVNGEH